MVAEENAVDHSFSLYNWRDDRQENSTPFNIYTVLESE